jgi:hypothetical protein
MTDITHMSQQCDRFQEVQPFMPVMTAAGTALCRRDILQNALDGKFVHDSSLEQLFGGLEVSRK